MNIGLDIVSGLRISIGDNLQIIENRLYTMNIKYTIPYRSNNSSVNNIIMYIEQYGVELNTVDGIVVFIKSSNSDLNYLCDADENSIKTLDTVKNSVARNFGVDKKVISVERFEARTSKSVISVPFSNNMRVKITAILGLKRRMFVETIELISV